MLFCHFCFQLFDLLLSIAIFAQFLVLLIFIVDDAFALLVGGQLLFIVVREFRILSGDVLHESSVRGNNAVDALLGLPLAVQYVVKLWEVLHLAFKDHLVLAQRVGLALLHEHAVEVDLVASPNLPPYDIQIVDVHKARIVLFLLTLLVIKKLRLID